MKKHLKKLMNNIGVDNKTNAREFSLFLITILSALFGLFLISWQIFSLVVIAFVVVSLLYFGLSRLILNIIDDNYDE